VVEGVDVDAVRAGEEGVVLRGCGERVRGWEGMRSVSESK
jgi:hypothetical protein